MERGSHESTNVRFEQARSFVREAGDLIARPAGNDLLQTHAPITRDRCSRFSADDSCKDTHFVGALSSRRGNVLASPGILTFIWTCMAKTPEINCMIILFSGYSIYSMSQSVLSRDGCRPSKPFCPGTQLFHDVFSEAECNGGNINGEDCKYLEEKTDETVRGPVPVR